MAAKPIKLTDFNVQSNARVVVTGTLSFSNITHKNEKSQFQATYGVTIDNPSFSTPDKDPNSSAFKNDANLARYLGMHLKREQDRHGRNRLHLTWKSGGKLQGRHMPIAGKANRQQLQAVDSGNLLAKRDNDNHILNKDGEPIEVNGQPQTDVSKIPDADDKVAFNQLASGQKVQVTYVAFESKKYHRIGSTIRALVVPDLENLDLYKGQNSISQMGLTPNGDDTVKIDLNSDTNESSAENGNASSGNPFAAPSSASANPTKSSASSASSKPGSANSNGSKSSSSDDDLPF